MTKNEIVYIKLKEMILNHDLDESSPLNERELSKLFVSSRTPVREAINRLSDQGLLYVIPGRGTFIKKISVEDVIEIYNIKEALDCLAISLAMKNITEAQIGEMERITREMEASAFEESAEIFFKLDIEFHGIYTQNSESERLVKILKSLDEQIIGYITASVKSKERMDLSIIEHKSLLKAILDRDVDRAVNVVREHMSSVKQFHINRISNI